MPMPDEPRRRAEEIRKQNEWATRTYYEEKTQYRNQQTARQARDLAEFDRAQRLKRTREPIGHPIRSRKSGFSRLILLGGVGLFVWFVMSHGSPTVDWTKCGNLYCALDDVDLSRITASGVFMIWHDGDPGRVIRVGQGEIADRIRANRNDPATTAYRASGTLRVTWAELPAAQWDGVERYLADSYHPLLGDAHPNVAPIAVDLLK